MLAERRLIDGEIVLERQQHCRDDAVRKVGTGHGSPERLPLILVYQLERYFPSRDISQAEMAARTLSPCGTLWSHSVHRQTTRAASISRTLIICRRRPQFPGLSRNTPAHAVPQ